MQKEGKSQESITEFKLIELLTKDIEIKNTSTKKGIGDDAAIINHGEEYDTLISTDTLIEGINFDLSYTPLKHLGYKSVVVGISDIIAMNGIPEQITISISISNRFNIKSLEEMYTGIKAACSDYEVDFVGGDTTSSISGLSITITSIGKVQKNKAIKRDGANLNDLICVTGDLGGAYMGLQLLERENTIFQENPESQPQLGGNNYILRKQLKPNARIDIRKIFKELNISPNAMIDISDGLASEILHICKQSKKGCKIFQEKIPIAEETIQKSLEFNIEPTIAALNGGDDFELLFTIPLNDYEKIRNHMDFTAIGHITDKDTGCFLVTPQNNSIEIKAPGWHGINQE